MDELARWSGWLGAAVTVAAGLVPILHRLSRGRRALPGSRAISWHVVLGLSTWVVALLHTFAMIPALGSPAAVRGGMTALLPGAVAFFALFAHVGVGLRLRNVRLRDRVKVRRLHVILALTIVTMIATHVVALVVLG